MPESVRWVLDFFLSTGITAAAVAGAVVWLSKEWLSERIKSQIKGEYDQRLETHKAQLKAQGDVEIEKLKSELSIVAQRQQLMFSNLHQKRADVIAEVYALLKDAVVAVADYTKAFEPAGGPSREERKTVAADAANAFSRFLNKNKIFLPESAAKKLDDTNMELKQAFFEFAFGIDMKQDQNADHAQRWIDITKKVENLSKIAIAELERDLRTLLDDNSP